jgi:glycerol-3-phosphate dehydrogenase (NAD(P)+)
MKSINSNIKLLIYGGGAWGTALAVAYAPARQTTLMVRSCEMARDLKNDRENKDYLPGTELPEELFISHYDERIISEANVILMTTPVAAFDEALAVLARARPETPILFACKGLHHRTGETLTHMAQSSYKDKRTWGVLSGPTFAQGVAAGDPTAFTVATTGPSSESLDIARLFSSGALRCYATDDIVGVQIGGALKNIYAIAAGAIQGAGWGENTRAALLARAMNEILLFGTAHGARLSTLIGLSGLGDLHLTCSSQLSRNFQVGKALAQGDSIAHVLSGLGHVAEGVATTKIVCEKAASLGIAMPIAAAILSLIRGDLTVHDAMEKLLLREIKFEKNH